MSGFWTGDQVKQDIIWGLNPEIVPEAERAVLPVPHTAEDRTALETVWTRAKRPASGSDTDRRHNELGELLDRCRRVLGPADRAFGGLRRVRAPSGEFLWVRASHCSEYDPGLPPLPRS